MTTSVIPEQGTPEQILERTQAVKDLSGPLVSPMPVYLDELLREDEHYLEHLARTFEYPNYSNYYSEFTIYGDDVSVLLPRKYEQNAGKSYPSIPQSDDSRAVEHEIVESFLRKAAVDFRELVGFEPASIAGMLHMNQNFATPDQGIHIDTWFRFGEARRWLVEYVAGTGRGTIQVAGTLPNYDDRPRNVSVARGDSRLTIIDDKPAKLMARITPTSMHIPPEVDEPRLLMRAFFLVPPELDRPRS